MAHPLTRTAQVVDVLKAGGQIMPTGNGRLLRLVDQAGADVPAWQKAISSAASKHKPATLKVAEVLEWIDTARDDIMRGDLLDAMDSLEMARTRIKALRDSRFAGTADNGGRG